MRWGGLRAPVVCVALAFAAHAASDARELFQRGSKALERGDDLEAVADFDAAYAATPAPSLLYWMAEAHFKAGHSAKSEELFKRYLAEQPAGPKVAEAKARLEELKPGRKHHKLALGEVTLAPARPAKAPPTKPPPASDQVKVAPPARTASVARPPAPVAQPPAPAAPTPKAIAPAPTAKASAAAAPTPKPVAPASTPQASPVAPAPTPKASAVAAPAPPPARTLIASTASPPAATTPPPAPVAPPAPVPLRASVPSPALTAAAPAPSSRSMRRNAGLIVGGAGLAAAGASVVFALQSKWASNDVSAAAAAHQPFDPQRDRDGRRAQTISLLTGAGAVIALALAAGLIGTAR